MTKPEHAGRSIIEMLWEQLDVKFAQLMEATEDESMSAEDLLGWEPDENLDVALELVEGIYAYRELRGQVRGLAYAIAKLINPHKPNIDAIREEAEKRWKDSR